MNILIKLTCLVGLVIAPILGNHGASTAVSEEKVQIEMTIENEVAKATINYTTTENGVKQKQVQTFTGTESEVKNAVESFKANQTKKKENQ